MKAALMFFGLAAGLAVEANAQILLDEHFSPPAPAKCDVSPFVYFPPGWTRFNVDNRTPDPSVQYVNAAWIVREDFSFNTNECAAFSTSWYSPAGAADDFMCTPPVGPLPAGTQLGWRAVTYDPMYPDGYEVRVMTTAPTGGTGNVGNLVSASTVLFTTPAENTTWTARTAALDAYAGQTVYVCFRNTSVDRFLLLVDDVKIAADTVDLATSLPISPSEYARVPFWNGQPIRRAATLGNLGTVALTDVVLEAQTRLGADAVATDLSSPIATFASGGSQLVTVAGTRGLDAPGTWLVHYAAHASQSALDLDPANDVADSSVVVAGLDELARDNGVSNGSLGIGGGNGGELGQHFDLPTGARVRAIRYVLADVVTDPPYVGGPVVAHLRAWDDVAGKPGALIASTAPFMASATGATVDADLIGGAIALAPGRYVATVEEPTTATLALALSVDNFTLGTTWVDWPTNPSGTWANNEDFGPSFRKTYRVSLLFGMGVFTDGFEDVPTPGASDANAHAVARDATRRDPQRPLRLDAARDRR